MSKIVDQVIAANKKYTSDFGAKKDLALPPARGFAILTCMDARLDPAKYAGLAEGDAHVIRNAGGRATDDAIRSLVISHKMHSGSNMSEPMKRARHYRQRAAECEKLAEWSAWAEVREHCHGTARRYLFLAEEEENLARGLADLNDRSAPATGRCVPDQEGVGWRSDEPR